MTDTVTVRIVAGALAALCGLALTLGAWLLSVDKPAEAVAVVFAQAGTFGGALSALLASTKTRSDT